MYRIVLILIFIVPFVTFSNIWTKADGPYQYIAPFKIFSFNDELYIYYKDGGIQKYLPENEEWKKLDTGFFVDKGIIHNFYQRGDIAITTTQEGVYWSYDKGEKWNRFDKNNGEISGFVSVEIVDQTIFLQTYNSSIYKLEKDSKTLDKIYTDETNTDSIFADIMVSKDNYLFAADPKQYSNHQPEFGKLYISDDKGETWTLSKSMRKHIVNLLFHNDILFAFTNKNELFRSTDYGQTWTTDTSVHLNGKRVISYKDLIIACSNQVLVSSDNGESWYPLNNGLDWLSCNDILINDNKLYYHTGMNLIYTLDYVKKYWNRMSPLTDDVPQGFLTETRDTLFSTGNYTINYSVDNGESWEMYSDSLYFRYSGLIDITISDSIFVCVSGAYNNLIISNDFGESWRSENLGIFSSQPWINRVIIMGNRIFVSTTGYGNFISEDAGLSWKEYDNEILKNDKRINKYFRLNDSELILYSEEGIYLTHDNGLTWKFEKTDNEELNTYDYSSKDGNNIYNINRSKNKISKSTDLGRTWTNIEINIESNLVFVGLITYNNHLILFTTTDLFILSNDGKDLTKYKVDLLRPNGEELYFNNGIVSGEYLVLTSEYGNWRAKLADLGIEVKSLVESEIESNYLYTYPPYPNPAKSEVKVLFYWDINLPMTTDDISIYDITGKKIDAAGKLSLVKQESHYGNLIWDCSSVQPGIYLINIKHGTEEKAVKVVVE